MRRHVLNVFLLSWIVAVSVVFVAFTDDPRTGTPIWQDMREIVYPYVYRPRQG